MRDGTSTVEEGRVALVTGAGSGLGAATARAFAGAGYAVAALDLREGSIAGGDDVTAYGCDVGDAGAVSATVAAVLARHGRVDVAVNAAGVDHTYWVEEMTVEQFDQVISVNLRGPFLVAKAVWPAMRAQGGGHIVNVASTAAVRAWSGASAYHASKFGLVGLGRGLSVEGRGENIRVTTLIPGGMNTGFFERFKAQGIPMPDPEKLQSPDAVAQAILFAARAPAGSVVQELVVTPIDEPSWP